MQGIREEKQRKRGRQGGTNRETDRQRERLREKEREVMVSGVDADGKLSDR